MEHLFLLTFTLGIFSLNAQHEAYFKTADNIEHSANRSTVMMAMAENLPNFKMVTGAPQVLDSVYVMEADKRIPEAFELLQFVSSEEKVLMQYVFFKDALYGKNISILYSMEETELANDKYDSMNIRLEESHRLKYFRNGGDMATVDKDVAAGRTRVYPIKNIDDDILEVTTGVIYNIEDLGQLSGMANSKGMWVYMTVYNTYNQQINRHYDYLRLTAPYATLEELMAKPAEMPSEFTTTKQDAELKAKREALEQHKAEQKAAAEAAAAEQHKGKKKKKKSKEAEVEKED